MVEHSKQDCRKVVRAMKTACDYALYAINNENKDDCQHQLDQIRQLLEQLEREHG
jgi:predicted translin family RNA/ssDNA-binding protein